MCTLAVYYQSFTAFPLVVAANRDEYIDRPAAEPERLLDEPAAMGGRDLLAGGTWLGLNAAGLVAALLNRRSQRTPDKRKRSRGLLCLDALRCQSVEDTLATISGTDPCAYNPFNLLVATVRSAAVVSNDGTRINVAMLSPGLHLLSSLDVDDPACPRIAGSFERFEAAGRSFAATGDLTRFRIRLREILSDHTRMMDAGNQGPLSSLCIHAGPYGTRSSTMIFCPLERGEYLYFHAPGPPCRTDYLSIQLPF